MPNELLMKTTKFLHMKKWIQFHYATDKYGNAFGVDSPEAVCFCAVGATTRVCHQEKFPEYALVEAMSLLNRYAALHQKRASFVALNDRLDMTKKEIIQHIKKAAELDDAKTN